VHIFGYPADMPALERLAGERGLWIVEDACEALGAEHGDGTAVGARGNPSVFAFYPNKQMTTGEGGMVTTDDPGRAAELRSLSNQGRSDTGDWLEHDRLGFNYRMDELSAAVGVGQMERLDEILAARAAVARTYDELLAGMDGVTTPAPGLEGDERSWFVYVVRLHQSIDRNAAMAGLQARGVACKPYLPAVHLQPFYRSLGHEQGECPVAEAVARSTLALPFHTRLAAADQEYVATALRDVLTSA
jgi:perosamine synthetase